MREPEASFETELPHHPSGAAVVAVAGTAAMFLVGGGILAHGFHPFEQWVNTVFSQIAEDAGGFAGVILALGPALAHALLGIVAGAAVLALVTLARRVLRPAAA